MQTVYRDLFCFGGPSHFRDNQAFMASIALDAANNAPAIAAVTLRNRSTEQTRYGMNITFTT